MFQRKLKRAQDALAHTSKTKSLTASFGDKMPYKRIVSALSPMAFRPDKIGKSLNDSTLCNKLFLSSF